MGILFLTVKQERCSDLLLWFAAWLLPPLRLRPKLMLTTATATALATEDSATPDSATPDSGTLDLATETDSATDTDSSTARGRLRPSPRLRPMPSTDTELTPTPLDTVTPPLPSLPPPSPPLPSATPVSDTLVSDTPVLATELALATLVSATDTDSATATVWELTTELTSDKFVQLR